MPRLSRRALLAVAGSAVLAGCSGEDDPTVTPYDGTLTTRPEDSAVPSLSIDGTEPLGTRVPATAADPPVSRERVLDTSPSLIPVGVVPSAGGLDVVANTLDTVGVQSPSRISLDAEGSVVGRTALDGLPDPRLRLVRALGGLLVVGGYTGDPVRTWFRGFREGTSVYRYTSPAGVPRRFRALGALGGDLLATGPTDGGERSVVARLVTDGTAGWTKPRYTADDLSLRAITSTPAGILVGGSSGGTAWLSTLDPNGRIRWSRTLLDGDTAYSVRDVASGPSGTYALVGTETPDSRPGHLVLVALDGERVRWVRGFDPRARQATLRGGAVVDADGPTLLGNAATENAALLVSLAPDGGVRWADYYRVNDRPTRPAGLASVDGTLVACGTTPSSHMPERSNVWLAWL